MHAHPLIRREFQNDPTRAIPSGCVSQWTPGHRRTGVCMCARTSRRRRDGRQRCCAACNLGRSMVKQLNPSHDRTHTSTLTYKLCLVIRQYGPVSMSRHSHAVTDTFGYLRDITIAPVGFNFQAEHTHTNAHAHTASEQAERRLGSARAPRANLVAITRCPNPLSVCGGACASHADCGCDCDCQRARALVRTTRERACAHVQRDIVTRPLIRS